MKSFLIFPVILSIILPFMVNCQVAQDSISHKIYTWSDIKIKPVFPECDKSKYSEEKRSNCSKDKLLNYIGEKLVFPAEARNNGIGGQVVAQFIITKDGMIDGIKILRDPGGGLGNAVADAIYTMNNMKKKWIPGIVESQTVDVLFTMPLKFNINNRLK